MSPQHVNAAACDLSYSIISDKKTIGNGERVTRTITIKNNGTSLCRGVSQSLFYGTNEKYLSASPLPRASNYYWYHGNMKSGASVKVSVLTEHILGTVGSEVKTEGCLSAHNSQDVCGTSLVTVGVPTVVLPPVPPITTVPRPAPTPSAPVSSPTTKEQGMWVWDFAKDMNTPAGDAQLKQLALYKFNALYLTIDDYLDIAVLPEGANKNSLKAAYFKELSIFITKANSLGMAVDAEGGARDWAEPKNRWKGFALIDAAKEYNVAYPNAKLRGFQYDVEPYILERYEGNKEAVLTEFVEFIDQSNNRLIGSSVKFSVVIPHFYDKAQAWTPTVSYGGRNTHTFNHLLTILEKNKGSTILLMSYRNFFEGANGTREISEAEIEEARTGGYSTKIIVAQETGNVDPSFVTFYGASKNIVMDELVKINQGFSTYGSYAGTAVHYVDSFLDLK